MAARTVNETIMSDKGKLHEQGFNYALAAALRKCFPAWSPEGY